MRLIFFGDSFTFGWGAPDCSANLDTMEFTPSPTAWPAQVAALLGCDYINTSSPGASNQEILYNLRKFDRQPDDFIVIQWSYDDRDMLVHSKGFDKIHPILVGKLYERYYKLHSDADMRYRSDLTIEHADLLLRGTRHLMLANNWYNRPIDRLIEDIEMDHCVDRWPDEHPGPETNRIWAALVADMIKRKGAEAP